MVVVPRGWAFAYYDAIQVNLKAYLPTMVVADYDNSHGDDVSFIIQNSGGQGTGTLYTFLSNGDGTMALSQTRDDFGGGLAVADMDHNGNPDIVYWAKHNEDVNLTIDYASVSNSTAHFDQEWVTYNFLDSYLFQNIGLGDINNDGFADPVFDYSFGSNDQFALNYWLNTIDSSTGKSTLTDKGVVNYAPTGFGPNKAGVPGLPTSASIFVEDLNADGWADVAAYRSADGLVFFNTQSSSQYYSGHTDLTNATYLSGNATTMSVGDVDNNGLPDLVFLDTNYEGVSFVLNQFVATPPGYTVQTTEPGAALVTLPTPPAPLRTSSTTSSTRSPARCTRT
jgi:hypothetical protein